MSSLFLALVLYPEVKKRAQAELDSVLGRDRLPTFGDRPHLPYIDAMCKELMRWQMVTPMGAIISIIKNLIRDAKSMVKAFLMHQRKTMSTEDFLFQKVCAVIHSVVVVW